MFPVGYNPSDKCLQEANALSFKTEYDNGNSGSSKTIDWNKGQKQKITMTGNCTLSFTAPTTGVANFQLKLIQDGTGSRVVTWPSIKWPGGTAGVLTTTASAEDIVSFYYDGSSWYAQIGKDFKVPA